MNTDFTKLFPTETDPTATEHPCDYCSQTQNCPLVNLLMQNADFIQLHNSLKNGNTIGGIHVNTDQDLLMFAQSEVTVSMANNYPQSDGHEPSYLKCPHRIEVDSATRTQRDLLIQQFQEAAPAVEW